MREIILPEIISYRLPEGTKKRLLAAREPFESIASTGRRAMLEWLEQMEKKTCETKKRQKPKSKPKA